MHLEMLTLVITFGRLSQQNLLVTQPYLAPSAGVVETYLSKLVFILKHFCSHNDNNKKHSLTQDECFRVQLAQMTSLQSFYQIYGGNKGTTGGITRTLQHYLSLCTNGPFGCELL